LGPNTLPHRLEQSMAISLDERAVPTAEPLSLTALCWIFLCIGSTSFGGYMAMISAVQNMIVERHKLLSDRDVLDGVSLASVLPGPVAVNVVAYVGYRLRGGIGALACVCAAVAPGFALMVLFSAVYLQWGQLPAVGKIFMGVVPAVSAIILAAAWNMRRQSVTGWREAALAIAAAAALLGIGGLYVTLAIIVGAAAAGCYYFDDPATPGAAETSAPLSVQRPAAASASRGIVSRFIGSLLLLTGAPGIILPLLHVDLGALLKLFTTFAAMSLLLFGGAYVFIPLLQQAAVDGYGWLTQQEFVDAVAMGQLTPGPVIVSAAFIGYKLAGFAGALVATVAIIAPATTVMVLCTRVFDRFKHSRKATSALRGVRAAVVGMVFAAAITIVQTARPGWISIALGTAAFVALVRYRIEAIWIVPLAGLTGFLAY
jgi:chromate transporter